MSAGQSETICARVATNTAQTAISSRISAIPAPFRHDGAGAFMLSPREPFDAVGRGEGVERDVPFIGRDGVGDALHRPANADEPRALSPQAAERAVVMALAAAEAGPAAVDCDQRNQNHVRLDRRRAAFGLDDS